MRTTKIIEYFTVSNAAAFIIGQIIHFKNKTVSSVKNLKPMAFLPELIDIRTSVSQK